MTQSNQKSCEYVISLPLCLVWCCFLCETSPDTEDADGWVPVPCPAGHLNLDCTVPTMKTWELHTSSDGTMLSGMWEATPVSAGRVYFLRQYYDSTASISVGHAAFSSCA